MKQINMFEEMYEKLPIWNKSLSIIEMYGGIGSQLKSLTNLGLNVETHTLIEVDIDATISYVSIHCEFNEKLQNYNFPTKEKMISKLEDVYILDGIKFIDKELKRHSKIVHKKQGFAFPYKVKQLNRRKQQLLMNLNWWSNDKPKEISKLKLSKLKKLYLAQKLSNNLGNVFNLEGKDLPKVDLITWSTPCQDFSLAGKQAGFDGKKGGLTFITLKLFKELKELNKLPNFLLFENVPAIMSKTFIHGFNVMRKDLRDLGYENLTLRLNAKNFGIPQNRDRVFILSIKKEYLEGFRYDNPKPIPLKLRLKDMLEDEVDEKYYLSDIQINKISNWNSYRNPLEHTKSSDDKTMHCITAKSNTTMNASMLLIKEATKKGYAEAGDGDGDGVYINRPHQKRGVVQKGMIQTIKTSPDVGVVVADFSSSKNFLGNKSRFKENVEIMDTILTEPKKGIIVHNVIQQVSVRKYKVDIKKLQDELSSHKNISNKIISDKLLQPLTLVEHWFRKDESFSIPKPEIWFRLKGLLNIITDEFDKSIMEFETKDNVYEKSNRVYDEKGISPTLTAGQQEKIIVMNPLQGKTKYGWHFEQQVYDEKGITRTIKASQGSGNMPKVIINGNYSPSGHNASRIVDKKGIAPTVMENYGTVTAVIGSTQKNAYKGNGDIVNTLPSAMGEGGGHTPMVEFNNLRIRKLTPLECWRLMGFEDNDFYKASQHISDSQLYKQAGNSIVIDVLYYIFKNLFLGGN